MVYLKIFFCLSDENMYNLMYESANLKQICDESRYDLMCESLMVDSSYFCIVPESLCMHSVSVCIVCTSKVVVWLLKLILQLTGLCVRCQNILFFPATSQSVLVP